MMKNIYISCELVGGLGNQLFQVATTLSYCKKREYNPIFQQITESKSIMKNRPVYWDSYLHKIKTCNNDLLSNFIPYSEPKVSYTVLPEFNENTLLKGYFQSANYFNEHQNYIQNTFKLPLKQVEKLKSRYRDLLILPNKVAIHIRRGDYLKLKKYHTVLSDTNYYEKALQFFPNQQDFIVFSDDIDWCKQFFKQKTTPWLQRYSKNKVESYHKHRRWHFVQDTDINELYIMSQCQHYIIANSSFSWWGCYLSHSDGIVVAPKRWFGPKVEKSCLNYRYLAHWKRI